MLLIPMASINHNLFKSNLFYECSFVVNNKIILFNNKNCFLKFRELKKLDIKKENIYFLGKKNKTVFIGASLSLRKIKTVLKDKTFSLENLRDCINLVNNEHVMISPVPDVGGAASNYLKKTDLTFEKIRNTAWLNSRNS